MKLSTLTLSPLLLVGSTIANKAHKNDNGHNGAINSFTAPGDHWLSFEPYSESIAPLLQEERTNLFAEAPQITILTSIPPPEDDIYYWSTVSSIAIRNSYQSDEPSIFKLQAAYMIANGVDMGCRITGENGTEKPVDSPLCIDHCTHQGRYCPAELPTDIAKRTTHNGKALIRQVIRHLCFGDSLPTKYSHHLWFDYLRAFQAAGCIANPAYLEVCGQRVIEDVLASKYVKDVDTEDVAAKTAVCAAEADADTDTTNPMLEAQLKLLKEIPYSVQDLPVMDIDGDEYNNRQGMLVSDVLHKWCSYFPDAPANDKQSAKISIPITCSFCNGCMYAYRCLEDNQCDNYKFNVTTFKDPKAVVKEPLGEVILEDTEVVLRDLVMLAGGALLGGVIVGAICLCLAKRKREQAIAEVSKALPMRGYNDKAGEQELPEVA